MHLHLLVSNIFFLKSTTILPKIPFPIIIFHQTMRTCLRLPHSTLIFQHQSISCLQGPVRHLLSLKLIFLFIYFSLSPPASRPSSPFQQLHFSWKPSWISVCIRAESSTNLASTFSFSSKGFRAVQEKNTLTSCSSVLKNALKTFPAGYTGILYLVTRYLRAF